MKVALLVACIVCANAPALADSAAGFHRTAGYEQRPLLGGREAGAGLRGATLRLRGGGEVAKAGGLFAASISRWQHDDIMQVPRSLLL